MTTDHALRAENERLREDRDRLGLLAASLAMVRLDDRMPPELAAQMERLLNGFLVGPVKGAWSVTECTDEYTDECPCIVVRPLGGDRVEYIADAETPELAALIVAEHNEAVVLRKRLADTEEMRDFHARSAEHVAAKRDVAEQVIVEWEAGTSTPEVALARIKTALAVGDIKGRAGLEAIA